MRWMVDTMLAIESLASESDVFVGVFVGTYLSCWVMTTLAGVPKFCSGTKFLKSSSFSQVVSELNNILNFPEVFEIF